jgi:hypothetical protein
MPAADRWAPWIEPTISSTADFVVNSTTPGNISGLFVSFTPHVDTRLAIALYADLAETTPGADTAVVRVQVNGVTLFNVNVTAPSVADRFSLTKIFTVDLTALTTYTIAVQAFLAASTGTVWTLKQLSSLNLIGMPNLHS